MKNQKVKSMILAALAALSFAAPIALSTPAAADSGYDRRDDRRGDRRDHRDWRRGDRPSADDRRHWRQVDYRQHRYHAPPRGYRYVRDDRTGQVLLVGIATGVILSIIANS